jgi:hypothetical protein
MATRQTFDGQGNLLSTEIIPDVVPMLMPLDIVARFTPAELLAIEQSTNLSLVAFRTQFFAALNPIALDDPRFQGAVTLMQSLGILTTARANAIRANELPA